MSIDFVFVHPFPSFTVTDTLYTQPVAKVKVVFIPEAVLPPGKFHVYERMSLSGSLDPLAEKFTTSGMLPAVGLAEITAFG
jgi:hypothetical protein